VEPDNQNPLDELQMLDRQIDQVTDLAGLKPIFFRLDELAKQHSSDFEVQLAVTEIKQRVVSRGTALKQFAHVAPPAVAAPLDLPPPLPPQPPKEGRTTFQAPPSDLPTPSSKLPPPLRPATPAPGAKKAPAATKWKRALLLGVISGALVSIVILALLVNQARKRKLIAPVQVQIATIPTGAAISVNGQPKCNSNCAVALPPGDYQVTASLDGFQPSTSTIKVAALQPARVNLNLEPQQQMLRILTDLTQGRVILDDQPRGDLQDGQFVINNLDPGKHNVKVTSKTGDAAFTVEISGAKPPEIAGPVAARNLIAVVVASMGSKARVATNSPVKVALNGQAQAEATPAGVDVEGFRQGVNEIAVGQGKDQRNLSESFGQAPMVTAFLKSDINIGTLIISTAEDDVRVLLNGKEYPRKTQRGQLRIQTLGKVDVRVAKEGFELSTPQTAEVKKGSEVRLEFKLQPQPEVAILQIHGATPGAEVLLDQKSLGAVGDDGSFTANSVPPGEHVIELRKDQYVPKRMQRQFAVGHAIALNAPDVAMTPAIGTVRLVRIPADASVVYRRADETQSHDLRGNQLDLPPGSYVFTARAPGYAEKTEKLQVNAGATQPLELALGKIAVAPPPAPKLFGMGDFEDPNAWSKQGDLWSHKGGGVIPYKLPTNGTFTFTVRLLRGGSLFRGGRIRWAVQYTDSKNYDLFELDRKVLSSKVIEGGKTYDRGKFEHGLNDKDMLYTIQIDVSPGQLVHRLQNGENWVVLDTWKEPGRKFNEGKFAFLVQGNDEIGLSDFKFTPR
jgi:hypothetical protein